MSRGGNISWDDTRANFNDVNSAMSNATTGISQAGNVFGQLRKSILDEEQRAVDNNYRARLFDENVRQFGMQHALSQDKLSEEILSNRNTEGLTARGQDVQTRGQDLSHSAAMAGIGVQRERLDMDKDTKNYTLQRQKEQDDLLNKQRMLTAEGTTILTAPTEQIVNMYKETTQRLANPDLSPEERKSLEHRSNLISQARSIRQDAEAKGKVPSAASSDYLLSNYVSSALGTSPTSNTFAASSAYEKEQASKDAERSIKSTQQYAEQVNKMNTIMQKEKLEDSNGLIAAAVNTMYTTYGIDPETAINTLLSQGTSGSIIPLNDNRSLNISGSTLQNFVMNPKSSDNPIAVLASTASRTPLKVDKEEVSTQPTLESTLEDYKQSGGTKEALTARAMEIGRTANERLNMLGMPDSGVTPYTPTTEDMTKALKELRAEQLRKDMKQAEKRQKEKERQAFNSLD